MITTPLTKNVHEDRRVVLLENYEANGGYRGARKSITKMTPSECLQVIKDSNLRGRGGAGFPTGMKWSFVPMDDVSPGHKYLVCNADEMEPGTFKDRLLMECDPHQLIEGMICGSYTIQADIAYIFLRGEYVKAAETLSQAIKECYAKGYLGKTIMGTNYSLDLYLHTSA